MTYRKAVSRIRLDSTDFATELDNIQFEENGNEYVYHVTRGSFLFEENVEFLSIQRKKPGQSSFQEVDGFCLTNFPNVGVALNTAKMILDARET